MTIITTRAYRSGSLSDQDFDLEAVSDQLESDDTIVWVDIQQPTREHFEKLADELGLHDLAVEDALEPHQRPKVDVYPDHLFLTTHSVVVHGDTGELEEHEVDAFLGDRFLITVRPDDHVDLRPVLDRWDRSPELVSLGVGYLLYCLLDQVLDSYFDAVETFDDFYEGVSDSLFEDTPINPMKQRDWFEMRRSLVRLHRLTFNLREAVNSLLRREHAVVDDRLRPYYQDVYDHVIRAAESTDELRDLVSTIVDTNLSLRDYRQNQVVKKVTSWAAIIAVPTLVTGFYGMNVPYFGSGELSGVWLSVALIAVLPIILYVQFKRHDWL